MTSIELQKLLNSPDRSGEVHLPQGEFEGPFVIEKPCKVIGNETTLWSGRGAVLTVKASEVSLEHLRAEITNSSLTGPDSIAISSLTGDTAFSDVEIIGGISGIEGEEQPWGVPKNIDLGKIPPERECSFVMELITPAAAELISTFHDISVYPERLEPGENRVTLTVQPIRSGSYIYGELLLRSKVTRRIYLSGVSAEGAAFEDEQTVFKADPSAMAAEAEAMSRAAEEEIIYPDIIDTPPDSSQMYKPEEVTEEPPEEKQELHSLYIIERGMHIMLECAEAEIELVYDNKDFPMDVDAFAFMTDKHGIVTQNDRFVFFGNDRSFCGGVKYLNAPDKKAMYINFNVLPLDIAGIDIAYSIYENPGGLDFSDLKNPAVRINLSDGKTLIYQLEKPLNAGTVVGAAISYTNSRWELSPLGMIYPKGLADLCGNYGLKIN